MKKNKRLIESIAIFIFFSVIVTLINLNNQDFSYDKIWVFHMMQKVANGDLIYSNINVIVGPIFYILGGLVFKIFGTSFFVYDCFGGILYGIFAVISYNICKEINNDNDKMINLLMIIVIYYFSKVLCLASYNILTLSFIMFAMLIEMKKYKKEKTTFSNILIGVFLSFAFFTKQTVGGMAIVATAVISLVYGILIEKKNHIRELLEKMLGFFIIAIPIIISMAIFGNLFDYIDLCFGSILEFGQNNFSMVKVNLYLSFMTSLLLAGPMIFKLRKLDKELLIIVAYTIASAFFVIPLANSYHAHLATFMIWFILLKVVNILKEFEKTNIVELLLTIPLVFLIISIYTLGGKSVSALEEKELLNNIIILNISITLIDISLMIIYGIGIIKKNDKFIKRGFICSSILIVLLLSLGYIKNLDEKVVPEGLEIYANHGFENEKLEQIYEVIEYIKQKENEGYNVKVISWDASEYMVPMNRNNNKYDLLLNGNLGYKGVERILEEMELWENTIILQNKEPFWQESEKIRDYVLENCSKIDEICGVDVYLKE